ncbi:MAG: hypothetical protein D6772_00360, partial [Bacteroidetes bacterium]
MTKHFLLLLGLLYFSLNTGSAQEQYTVYVGTFVEVRPQDFDAIRPLGFLYERQVNPNLHQVFMGRFRTEAKARALLPALYQRGFTNARVQAVDRSASDEQAVVIQIATRRTNKAISWTELEEAGPLNVILDDELIKVTTGTFPDIATAKNALPTIQAKGFDDAFIKTVPLVDLIPVTPLSTGIKQALIPLNLQDTPPRTATTTLPPPAQPANTPRVLNTPPSAPSVPRPTSRSMPVTTSQTSVIPSSYEQVARGSAGSNRIATSPQPRPENAPPAIRGDIKRRSALELQKILKAKGYYTSSLDGYYGPGTKSAYEQLRANDATYNRYAQLAVVSAPTTAPENAVQNAINELPYSADAPLLIERSQVAPALAYQAYLLFVTLGSSPDVDRLMNQANQQAYRGVARRDAPFDYLATYTYQDLGQLLQHLFYIHLAPSNDYQLPCWLRERHPQETAAALAALGASSAGLPWNSCASVMEWDPLKVLYGLAM